MAALDGEPVLDPRVLDPHPGQGGGVSNITSGSRFASEERLSAQAISQLLQATQRSAFTKMDFMILPGGARRESG